MGTGWLTCAAPVGMSLKTACACTQRMESEAFSLSPPHPLTLTHTCERSKLPWGHVRTRSTSHSNHSIAFALKEQSGRVEGRNGKSSITCSPPHTLAFFTAFPVSALPHPHKSKSSLAWEARLSGASFVTVMAANINWAHLSGARLFCQGTSACKFWAMRSLCLSVFIDCRNQGLEKFSELPGMGEPRLRSMPCYYKTQAFSLSWL